MAADAAPLWSRIIQSMSGREGSPILWVLIWVLGVLFGIANDTSGVFDLLYTCHGRVAAW